MADQETERSQLLGHHRGRMNKIADEALALHPNDEAAALAAATESINVQFVGILSAIALNVAISLVAEIIKRRILKRIDAK